MKIDIKNLIDDVFEEFENKIYSEYGFFENELLFNFDHYILKHQGNFKTAITKFIEQECTKISKFEQFENRDLIVIQFKNTNREINENTIYAGEFKSLTFKCSDFDRLYLNRYYLQIIGNVYSYSTFVNDFDRIGEMINKLVELDKLKLEMVNFLRQKYKQNES